MLRNSLVKKLGRLFLISPAKLTWEEVSFYREFGFHNFIFFQRHFTEEFQEYLELLKNRLGPLGLLAVDQEGGRVCRIHGDFMSPFEAAKLKLRKGEESFRNWARSLALAIKEQGLNLNLAPVVDLAGEEAEDFLRGRTFGEDPQTVIGCAHLFYKVHAELNILTCLKHFPGLGGVSIDPHEALPRKEVFSERDLSPFQALLPIFPLVMTTHLLIEAFDPYPITFSERAINLLRKDLNFQGIILTDDLYMKALSSYETPERLLLAMASGHNLLIYCGPWEDLAETFQDFYREVEKSRVLKERVREAFYLLEKLLVTLHAKKSTG